MPSIFLLFIYFYKKKHEEIRFCKIKRVYFKIFLDNSCESKNVFYYTQYNEIMVFDDFYLELKYNIDESVYV